MINMYSLVKKKRLKMVYIFLESIYVYTFSKMTRKKDVGMLILLTLLILLTIHLSDEGDYVFFSFCNLKIFYMYFFFATQNKMVLKSALPIFYIVSYDMVCFCVCVRVRTKCYVIYRLKYCFHFRVCYYGFGKSSMF